MKMETVESKEAKKTERGVFDAWGKSDCFDVKTSFADSTIDGAGQGRFIQEDVDTGDIIRKCPVYFDDYDPENHQNCIVAFKSIKDLELHLAFEDIPNRPINEVQVNNFACTPFNVVPAVDVDYVYWFQPPCYFNHAAGSNANVYLEMIKEADQFFFLVRTLRYMVKGDEIFIDYRNFKLPQWFKDYVEAKGMVSTEDLGILKSGVQIDDAYTIQTYKYEHDNYKDFINNFYANNESHGKDFAIASFMDKLPSGGKVLDLGCCTGWHAYMLHEEGFVVTAMDTSEKYIAELDSKINPIVGGFETLDFENVFDGFLLSWMLHHLQRDGISIALDRTFRALKTDGWLYLSTVEANEDYRDAVGRLYVTFTETELVELLDKHGFSVKYVEKHNLNHYEDTPMVGIVIHAQRRRSMGALQNS